MKAILTTLAIGGLLCCVSVRAEDTKTAPKNPSPDRVSIFEAPLQCPAAPQIGCGSRAKPLLLELERDSNVSEAWLNRAGTKIAVVWKPESKAKARRGVATKLKEQEATEIKGKPRDEAITEFLSGNGWYRGADVDRLSEEEAGIIAARLVQRVEARRGRHYRRSIGSTGRSQDHVAKGEGRSTSARFGRCSKETLHRR